MLLLLLLLPLDRRFGIQLSNYQEGQLQPAEATRQRAWETSNFGMLCVTHACWHLAAFYDFASLSLHCLPHSTPIQWHFEQSPLLPAFTLFYYIICDPNRKCYSSMSGASVDTLSRRCFFCHFCLGFSHFCFDWVLVWKSKSANLCSSSLECWRHPVIWPLANLHS